MVPGQISLYVCGPTVYGYTHVGNARPAIFFDVARRFLEMSGFQVKLVSNFTDVDDKIINRAREEKTSSQAISEKFTAAFIQDRTRMGVRPPTISPKVTESIPEIIQLIELLIQNGAAYVTTDGEVFYSVRKFSDYGKLSKKRLDDLRVGVRIDPNEKKADPLDFSLWKPQKAPDEPAWDSPWGKGRPGWHIECSAMAIRHLGETFDIHGGGLDLIHPHHENEIAQSEGATKKPFAHYWLHNNMINMGDEKMSKSLGNIFLNKDFMDRYSPEVLRFLILSGHYRSPIDFSTKHIQECQQALHRFYSASRRIHAAAETGGAAAQSPELTALKEFASGFETAWVKAMEDDFNSAKVVGIVFEYVRFANGVFDQKKFKPSNDSQALAKGFLSHFQKLGDVLGLFSQNPSTFLSDLKGRIAAERGLKPVEIEALLDKRNEARANKDYAASDAIRKDLMARGVEIRDTSQGSEWDVIFS